jgi:thiol-disulfide isomerase/thioredoxin
MFEILGIEELNKSIYLNKDKLIMLYFGALWCGPCKKLKATLSNPTEIEKISNMYICYLDIDNDNNKELVEIYNVESLPTIHFIKLNDDNEVEILDTVIGYDWDSIKSAYNEFSNNL